MCLNKTHLKIARIFKNTLSFIYCNKIENFGAFQVANFRSFFLFEEVRNFRGFRVFDFGPYTEIEISENSEILPTHVIPKNVFYLSPSEISEVSEFSILVFIIKSKTRQYSTNFYRLIAIVIVLMETFRNWCGFPSSLWFSVEN